MAKFRCETIQDPESKLLAVAVFYPDDAVDPVVTTDPIYQSEDEAMSDAIAIFKKALTSQPLEFERKHD